MTTATTITLILLAAGIFQGLLLLLFIATRRLKSFPPTFYLFMLIGTFWYQILMKVLNKAMLLKDFNTLYCLAFESPFLLGPTLYLYCYYSMNHGSRIRKADILHYLPFLSINILMILFDNWPADFYLYFFFPTNGITATVHTVLQTGSILGYSWLAIRLIERNRSKTEARKIIWYRQLIMLTAITGMTTMLAMKFLFFTWPRYDELRPLFLVLAVFVYWVSYKSLDNPDILGILQKYRKTKLSASENDRILRKLLTCVEGEKAYLKPELTIESLSSTLQTQKHLLSQVINERLEVNFYDFINSYRIKHAMELLSKDKSGNSIAQIAFESGFNSLSSFNSVFKKHTGRTPSEYKVSASVPI